MIERHSILTGPHEMKYYGGGNEGDRMYSLYQCACGYREKRYYADSGSDDIRKLARELADDAIRDVEMLRLEEGLTEKEAAHIVVWGRGGK